MINHVPFYIGKGTGDRLYQFDRNDSHRKIRSRIKDEGKEIVSIKLIENVSETEAFVLESKLIDILGLKATSKHGLLVNLDEGLLPNERRSLYPSFKGKMNRLLRRNGYVGVDHPPFSNSKSG